jgi:hypothetical protein
MVEVVVDPDATLCTILEIIVSIVRELYETQ